MSKEAVDKIVRKCIGNMQEMFKSLGMGDVVSTSEEEIEMMVNVMLPHFNISEEKFNECEEFLNSETFQEYSTMIKNMGEALLTHAQDIAKSSGVVH
jgi:hypothetical protein